MYGDPLEQFNPNVPVYIFICDKIKLCEVLFVEFGLDEYSVDYHTYNPRNNGNGKAESQVLDHFSKV
ncbi:hypothetical protein ACFOG5_02590 [Pedobacter fastidiosus]|uniref:hypothetical protein n=1 Tax=Pedobacter fastidiosus TaxID=2765361 RepID=UPI00361FCF7E